MVSLLLLWLTFYASFTLFRPALLDDADSVHVEVAREMLLRHDYVTLYANGIRYLEKAPLLYWSMALAMHVAEMLRAQRPEALAAAARVPLALAVLMLTLYCEVLARRVFCSMRAGLYSGLMVLSSFGIFIFTRITIPDAMVCLWITISIVDLWLTEEMDFAQPGTRGTQRRWLPWSFAASCALNVLTKGLIGLVFPLGIAVVYLWLTRGMRGAVRKLLASRPWSSALVFVAMAAPWHVMAGLANPTQGHPAPFVFLRNAATRLPWGHWQIPLPRDGNVRGWWWFYFVNEHLLRYLNLRVPRDYDTVPLPLFWGLCFVWLMPWSAFVFEAVGWAVPLRFKAWREQFRSHDLPLRERGLLLLAIWAGFVLLFFSLSTRQEYYVLPALPPLAVLIAGWLARRLPDKSHAEAYRMAGLRATAVLAILGVVAACVCVFFLLHTRAPDQGTELAQLLQQNPGEYALSMGHFLDLDGKAMGMFRLPLALTAVCLGLGWPLVWWLRGRRREHLAILVLAASAFGFLLAAHLGLQTFAPVLSSAQLANAIRPEVRAKDLLVIHGEYESGSTLGFYLGRSDLHILEGRSSNLWYGSFFPDAPKIFETPGSLATKWAGPQRIFLWQSLTDPPNRLPPLPGGVYVLARGGGKEIVSNQPNR